MSFAAANFHRTPLRLDGMGEKLCEAKELRARVSLNPGMSELPTRKRLPFLLFLLFWGSLCFRGPENGRTKVQVIRFWISGTLPDVEGHESRRSNPNPGAARGFVLCAFSRDARPPVSFFWGGHFLVLKGIYHYWAYCFV